MINAHVGLAWQCKDIPLRAVFHGCELDGAVELADAALRSWSINVSVRALCQEQGKCDGPSRGRANTEIAHEVLSLILGMARTWQGLNEFCGPAAGDQLAPLRALQSAEHQVKAGCKVSSTAHHALFSKFYLHLRASVVPHQCSKSILRGKVTTFRTTEALTAYPNYQQLLCLLQKKKWP